MLPDHPYDLGGSEDAPGTGRISSPHSQDLAALALISDAGAMSFRSPGILCPVQTRCERYGPACQGAGRNQQPEHTLADVEKWYEDAGGKVIS